MNARPEIIAFLIRVLMIAVTATAQNPRLIFSPCAEVSRHRSAAWISIGENTCTMRGQVQKKSSFERAICILRGLGPYLLWVLLAALFVIVSIPVVFYSWGLSFVDTASVELASPQPTLVRLAFWNLGEGSPEMRARRLTPWSFWTLVHSEMRNPAPIGGMRFPGARLATWIARRNTPHDLSGIERHAAEISLTIWLTRHRDAEALADSSATSASFGAGITGVESAATAYWRKPATELEPHEAAWLALVSWAPPRVLRSIEREPEKMLERRNELLRRMALCPEWRFGDVERWVRKPLRGGDLGVEPSR